MDRQGALIRLLDHYVHSARDADGLLHQEWAPLTLPSPAPGVIPERPQDHQAAVGWFAAEHEALLASVHHAARHGHETHAWQLIWTSWTFLDRHGHWSPQATAARVALAAADRLDDPRAQSCTLQALAAAETRLGLTDDACGHLQLALTLSDDPTVQAHALHNLGFLFEQKDPTRALGHARAALALCQASGDLRGQARSWNDVGWYQAQLGHHRQTLDSCQRALHLYEGLGDHHGLALTWDSIGFAHHHLGRDDEAIDCYQQALTHFRHVSDRSFEAVTFDHLGDAHRRCGREQESVAFWQQALTILDDLSHPASDSVRGKLAVP